MRKEITSFFTDFSKDAEEIVFKMAWFLQAQLLFFLETMPTVSDKAKGILSFSGSIWQRVLWYKGTAYSVFKTPCEPVRC